RVHGNAERLDRPGVSFLVGAGRPDADSSQDHHKRNDTTMTADQIHRTVHERSPPTLEGGSNQLADGLPSGEQRDRPAEGMGEMVAGVDAKVAVNGGEEVLRGEGGGDRVLAAGVGGANNLSLSQTAAGKQGAVGVGPVVPANRAIGWADAQPW